MKIIITDYQSVYFKGLKSLLYNVYDSDISEETLKTHYLSDVKNIILAVDEEKGDVLGCLFLEDRYDYVRPDHTLFLSYLAVDPSFRRQGIGGLLFKEAVERAKKSKCRSVEFTSADYREGAHAFHKAMGFTVKKTTVFIKDLCAL